MAKITPEELVAREQALQTRDAEIGQLVEALEQKDKDLDALGRALAEKSGSMETDMARRAEALDARENALSIREANLTASLNGGCGTRTPESEARAAAEWEAHQRAEVAREVVLAVLQHPNVHIYCGGNPLEPGGKYDGKARGAYLAERAFEFAGDLLARLNGLAKDEQARLAAAYLEELTGTT